MQKRDDIGIERRSSFFWSCGRRSCRCRHGFVFSSREIKVKIHNLTNKYRDEKKVVASSGGTPLRGRTTIKCIISSADTSILTLKQLWKRTLQIEAEDECSSSYQMQTPSVEFALELSSQPPKKRRKDNENFQYAFLQEIRAANQTIAREIQELKEDSREAQQIERERNGILEKF
ncbi:uncharacterized protein LOC129248803 [Anastrepha obliqua]|uniref:uncharacterized protein LOC129248803 n=1 Tax=Anastrepha obliqua TaxID=95512 RepID=UPI0024093D40|nr:uncharacterized protein LOC129248803 [Anastrepha obliqua]